MYVFYSENKCKCKVIYKSKWNIILVLDNWLFLVYGLFFKGFIIFLRNFNKILLGKKLNDLFLLFKYINLLCKICVVYVGVLIEYVKFYLIFLNKYCNY